MNLEVKAIPFIKLVLNVKNDNPPKYLNGNFIFIIILIYSNQKKRYSQNQEKTHNVYAELRDMVPCFIQHITSTS